MASVANDGDDTHDMVNALPDELLQHVFSLVDPRTLLLVIPAVCTRWRDSCLIMPRAHLDLRFKAAQLWGHHHEDKRIVAGAVEAARCMAQRFKFVASVNLEKHSDDVVKAVVELFSGLTSVTVGLCDNLTNAGVVAVAERCPTLTAITISFGYTVTDDAIHSLGTLCPQLTTANLVFCKNVSDVGVMALIECCPKLTTVSFRGCSGVTNASVVKLAEKCHDLSSVNFCYCSNQLTLDVCLEALAANCPLLKSIDCRDGVMWGTRHSEVLVASLMRRCPQLSPSAMRLPEDDYVGNYDDHAAADDDVDDDDVDVDYMYDDDDDYDDSDGPEVDGDVDAMVNLLSF